MVSGISVIKLFLTSTCLLSIFILSPVNTQCEEITIFRSTSLSQLFSIRIQLIAEGRFEFQYSPCIRPNCNSPENNPPTYTVRFMNGLGRIHKTCEGMLMNGTTLSNSTTMIISKCVPPLLRPVTFNSNGISLSGCRYFDINIAQEAGNSLNAVPISYESCNENATICNQYCDNPSHFFVVNNEGKESGDEDTYKEGKVDVEDENGENDETAESITDDTESLSTQRLEDFCNCSYIRSLECTNPMNYTNLCSPHRRPFCEEFDVFNDNFCERLCANVTQPCNIEGISLGRPEAEACTKLCLHISLSDSLSSVCVNQLIEKCEDLLNNSLLALCDLTTPPEDLTAIIYNYFKIIFSLVELEPINETLDNLEDFFENIEMLEECNPRIVTAFENQTIEIFSDIVNDLLKEVRKTDYTEFDKESFKNGTESFQEELLEIIEDFSTLLTKLVLDSPRIQTRRDNFNLFADNIDINSTNQYSYLFIDDIVGVSTELIIPMNQLNFKNISEVAVSVMVVYNLASYLDVVSQANNDSSNVTSNAELVTVNIYARKDNEFFELQEFSDGDPILINFLPLEISDTPLHDCVSWNVTMRNWSRDGIITRTTPSTDTVVCEISHFTSFSILVSPTEHESSGAEKTALTVITYIGCLVSIISLILAILFFISFRKVLNKGSLLYVHLNLAFALLIALILFVSTVDAAHSIHNLCVVTTALLHYFLLCSFCWMLAEGIMLYLMVIRVFGTAADKWYWLLPLGWGLPVPVVVTSAGVLEGKYKDYIEDKYCWLNAGNGAAAIWTFIVPMTIIIMFNLVILVMTVYSMVKGRKHVGPETDLKNIDLVKTAVKGTIILLPLMGITWIIGVFAVNQTTTVFAWLFTIFNSLQGTAFFILHVLKNDAIQRKMVKVMKGCCSKKRHRTISESKIISDKQATKMTGLNGVTKASLACTIDAVDDDVIS